MRLSLLTADTDQGKRIAEYAQSQLQGNLPGLEVTISSQPSDNVNQSRCEKSYELSPSGQVAGSSELDSCFGLYAGGSNYSYGNYHNAKYDQLIEDTRTVNANNPEKWFAEYKEAEDILLNQDAAQVLLYQSASNYLINPRLEGISYHLYGDYSHLRNAYLAG